MYKLSNADSFYAKKEDVQITILDTDKGANGVLTKVASADPRIAEFVDTMEVKEGKSYLHINAMAAGEYFGSNKNGDYFPEENLIKWFKTFETSPAHLFRHHVNKNPKIANGVVIYAMYNERMHRVELIVEADIDKIEDIEDAISKGLYPKTSMACHTPYDTCSICGNRATSRAKYCSHLKYQLNQILPDGRKVYAINDGPLRFFDISYVFRPAEATSSILEKVAEDKGSISSAELADLENLADMDNHKEGSELIKEAAMAKFADLIKSVDEGEIVQSKDTLKDILSKTYDLNPSLTDSLSKFPLSDVFNSLAEAGINPSIKFMAELFLKRLVGNKGEGLGEMIEAMMYRIHPAEIPVESLSLLGDSISNEPANPILSKMLLEYRGLSSLKEEMVEKRASEGYAAWDYNMGKLPVALTGPMLKPQELKQQAMMRGIIPKEEDKGTNWFKTLLTFGGAALISRYYISSLMDAKFNELEKNLATRAKAENNAKLGILKSAESKLSDEHTKLMFNESKDSGKLTKSVGDAAKSGIVAVLRNSDGVKAQAANKALILANKISRSVSDLNETS